jgi:hypothetical protein
LTATDSPNLERKEMTESVITPAPKAVVAFARRNASEERIRQTEEELANLKNPQDDGEKTAGNDKSLPAEEETFKKRYGDLRRHTQKIQEDFKKEIDELRAQLDQAARKEMKLPKSEDDLKAWATQYPDVYKIVETIAIKKAQEQTSGVEERLKGVDEMERNVAREKAEAELMRLHPDFDTIRDEDSFHEWAEQQPKWIQDALYNNDNDARSAARAIDLYKADMGIVKKEKKDSGKEAAKSVGTRGERTSPNGDNTEGVIRESQVAKMSIKEYEARAEEIQNAMRTGKFVYDMSGSAR